MLGGLDPDQPVANQTNKLKITTKSISYRKSTLTIP